jgi:hypothetical protein
MVTKTEYDALEGNKDQHAGLLLYYALEHVEIIYHFSASLIRPLHINSTPEWLRECHVKSYF